MPADLRRLALFLALPAALAAAPATQPTPVYSRPDADAEVVRIIKAGEELPAITSSPVPLPNGWAAITLPGPHELYVQNGNINKQLEIKDGSPLHTAPDSDSLVLTHSTSPDDLEITGLRGRWTQIRLNQPVTAYVQRSSAAVSGLHSVATAPLRDAPSPSEESTARSSAPPATGPGRAVPRTEEERSSLAALPRLFEGRFSSTRAPLRPRRPYDFGLEDENGTRFAYLDLSRLLLTEQIENYLNHDVVVYGVARPIPDTKDIVIAVESLQLR